MLMLQIQWKRDVDWNGRVKAVLAYYEDRPDLKFGPAKTGKAIPLIDDLCQKGCATRTYLNATHKLEKNDDVATILSNVTMAIQDSGNVWEPDEGAWYATVDEPYIYIVSPGFAAAWIKARGIS